MIGNVLFLTLGRFILGIAGGSMNVIFAKILSENFPDKYAARFGFLTNAGIALGIWVCFSIGAILPEPEDYEANKVD